MSENKLSDEQQKAIRELHEEIMAELEKPKKSKMIAGGLIPTCCDRCREKEGW